MKQIYLIGGTMGVGQTIICQKLKVKLNNSVLLDGDWYWDMNPFIVNKETKEMVLQNIISIMRMMCIYTIFGILPYRRTKQQIDLGD